MSTETEIYKTLGQNIVNSISEKWNKAVLEFIVEADFSEMKGKYFDEDDAVHSLNVHNFKSGTGLLIIELFELTTQKDKEWKSGTFTLYPNFQFQIKFQYD